MSAIENEINEIFDSIPEPDPVFIMKPHYSGGVSFEAIHKLKCTHPSPIVDMVMNYCFVSLDLKVRQTKKSRNDWNMVDSIRNRMVTAIRDILAGYQGAKNNKLTSLFRWYNHHLTPSQLRTNAEFESDLFAIYKYMLGFTSYSANKQPAIGIIAALEMVKKKYEGKGMVI